MTVLSRIQANPDIGTANATYVSNVVDMSKRIIAKLCHLPRFPELSQGYAKSNTSAGTDLSALDTNSIYVAANGSGWTDVSLTLANCTTVTATAAELQAQIRAEDNDYGFDEITVAYSESDTQYTVTSGRYGEASSVNFSFDTGFEDVARTLKLSPDYGGTEEVGGKLDEELEDAAVLLAEWIYRRLGVEGAKSATVQGGPTISDADIMNHQWLGPLICSRRRLL